MIFLLYIFIMLSIIKLELSKHIGNADFTLEPKTVEYTDEEIDTILAKRKDWESNEIVFGAMVKSFPDTTPGHFDRPITEIASMMYALQEIYRVHRGEYIDIKKVYKYAIRIYKNMYPDEMILYDTLVELHEIKKSGKRVLLWIIIFVLFAIISLCISTYTFIKMIQ